MASEYIGTKAQELRGVLNLSWPIHRGRVKNWEDMTLIWEHILTKELKIEPSNDQPIVLTEPALTPLVDREKTAEIMFETLNAPALMFPTQGIMALYAAGKTTGVAVDVGHGSMTAIPVFKGFASDAAIVRADLGGLDLADYLQYIMRCSASYGMSTTSEMEAIRALFERATTIKTTPAAIPAQEVTLPDGQSVTLGDERWRCWEPLFDPGLLGRDTPSLPRTIIQAVDRSPMATRAALWGEVLLTGGCCRAPGLARRVLDGLVKEAPGGAELRLHAPANAAIANWVGASILSELSSFDGGMITKAEYEEDRSVVHKRGLVM